MAAEGASERVSLLALAAAFLKLGTIAIGGPAAHIALMANPLPLMNAETARINTDEPTLI